MSGAGAGGWGLEAFGGGSRRGDGGFFFGKSLVFGIFLLYLHLLTDGLVANN